MNDDSELGPDLMQYESGRRNMKAKRVKLTAPVSLTRSGNRATAKKKQPDSGRRRFCFGRIWSNSY
jgi:hypothetical protein